MATFVNIKTELKTLYPTGNFEHLMFDYQTRKDGSKTEWIQHWDNTNRVRVVMHLDVNAEVIKQGKDNINSLILKDAEVVKAVDKDGNEIEPHEEEKRKTEIVRHRYIIHSIVIPKVAFVY